eukprot:TRINITY_DN7333_c0_g1_i1.p1 TRINITY_DN7333_c0_g1~~TRINITY_DN7333_c0_g1_i1.p1  ORF type:complete len:141 (-),score=12.38 TRINITY_DN7333_c0_g1_i1:116-538(-)
MSFPCLFSRNHQQRPNVMRYLKLAEIVHFDLEVGMLGPTAWKRCFTLRRPGPMIQVESDAYISTNGPLDEGAVVSLGPGLLRVKHLFHAVGPNIPTSKSKCTISASFRYLITFGLCWWFLLKRQGKDILIGHHCSPLAMH